MDDSVPKKSLTSQDLDMDLMAEAELTRLQRQYRIMEGDRNAFAEEATVKLARQRKVISALRKEHEILLADYKIASSQANKQKDLQATKELDQKLLEYDRNIDKINKKQAELKELNLQIKKIEKQVFTLRNKDVTDLQCKIRVQSGRKSIEMLENKLENCVRRFGSVLAQNKELREEIDHLLKQRARFNKLWTKLVEDLNDSKKLTLEMVEQANLAYDQREEWCNKLQALKARAQNDLMLHNQEMKELQRQLDYDGKLHEFLGIKGQKRIMRDLELKEARKRQMEVENMEKQLQMYYDTLQKIQEIAGEEDIDRLAAGFLKQEEENFALFNYVNELSIELEELDSSISTLKDAIEEQSEINRERAEKHKKTLDSLKEGLENATKEAEEEQKIMEQSEKELQDLQEGIYDIFILLGCDQAPILELLGENAKINNYNAMVYLGLIQKRISRLAMQSTFEEKHVSYWFRKN